MSIEHPKAPHLPEDDSKYSQPLVLHPSFYDHPVYQRAASLFKKSR